MKTDDPGERWTVSEVASMAHVTVRTLHHYDDIGLLEPSDRSRAGYRLYSEADLERLHHILVYRELGLALDRIGAVLDDPDLDRRSALEAQRALLVEKLRKTDAVLRAVDHMLESIERGTKMRTEEMFDGFEDLPSAPEEVRKQHREHVAETTERWGGSDAYGESRKRVTEYTAADWERIRAEIDGLEATMARLLEEGVAPEEEEAMDVAEAMRRHIDRWYYPCPHRMHAGLADMYEADPRFTAHYEKRAEGLCSFTADAIRANALRAWEEGG